MKLIEAEVKYPPGRTFPSKYGAGSQQNIVVVQDNGQESTIWFAAGHAAYTELRRGDRAQFVQDNKGKLQLLAVDEYAPSTPAPSQPQQSAELSPDRKREIAAYIQEQAKLYAFCFGQATEALKHYEPTEETLRAMASTLYISAQRKFNI